MRWTLNMEVVAGMKKINEIEKKKVNNFHREKYRQFNHRFIFLFLPLFTPLASLPALFLLSMQWKLIKKIASKVSLSSLLNEVQNSFRQKRDEKLFIKHAHTQIHNLFMFFSLQFRNSLIHVDRLTSLTPIHTPSNQHIHKPRTKHRSSSSSNSKKWI